MGDTKYFQNLQELLNSFNTAQLWKEPPLHKKPLTLKYEINHPQNYLDKNCVVFHSITAFYKSNHTNDTYLITLDYIKKGKF